MDAMQKRKWVTALKSGEYAQGTGALKDGDRYCCLGVARELFGLRKMPDYQYVQTGFLPKEIQSELATLNDDETPFEVIAGFIDQCIEPTE